MKKNLVIGSIISAFIIGVISAGGYSYYAANNMNLIEGPTLESATSDINQKPITASVVKVQEKTSVKNNIAYYDMGKNKPKTYEEAVVMLKNSFGDDAINYDYQEVKSDEKSDGSKTYFIKVLNKKNVNEFNIYKVDSIDKIKNMNR